MAEPVAESGRPPPDRPRRDRRTFGLLVGAVVVVGLLFAFALPGRTYLAQRQAVAAAEERVEVLDQHSHQLEERVAILRTDAEIERLAREQYGLVKPGEEAYGVLPAPGTPTPASGPPPPPKDAPGFWARLADRLSFWD